MKDWLIHFSPTLDELAAAYWQLRSFGALDSIDWIDSVWSWLDAFQNAELSPVLIEHDGVYPAVLWFTGYDRKRKTAAIHFAAHARYKPKQTLIVVREAVWMIKHNSVEIDELWAFFEKDNHKALRMAVSFGDLVRWEAL
jgi:hypothetical protein